MSVLDPLLVDHSTREALQLQRWRAEHVTRDLWRIMQGRAHWSVITRNGFAPGGGGTVVAGAGSLASLRAACFDVMVPGVARLGFTDHQLRVWRGSLRVAWQGLKPDESFALEDWLHRDRHSAVFRLEGATVRRNHGASEDLARAALKLLAAATAKQDDR